MTPQQAVKQAARNARFRRFEQAVDRIAAEFMKYVTTGFMVGMFLLALYAWWLGGEMFALVPLMIGLVFLAKDLSHLAPEPIHKNAALLYWPIALTILIIAKPQVSDEGFTVIFFTIWIVGYL
jgi:hypothetical protein